VRVYLQKYYMRFFFCCFLSFHSEAPEIEISRTELCAKKKKKLLVNHISYS